MITTSHEAMCARAKEYFGCLDAGTPKLFDLFTDDVVIYFPKFGVGNGKQALIELGTGLSEAIMAMHHPVDEYRYFPSGDHHLIVEGITRGKDRSNRPWSGGETPGGRNLEADVVAVGTGAAGLSAAIAATQAGSSVIWSTGGERNSCWKAPCNRAASIGEFAAHRIGGERRDRREPCTGAMHLQAPSISFPKNPPTSSAAPSPLKAGTTI